MIIEDNDGSPEIIWEKYDRYAIIAFLFISADCKLDIEQLKKFDVFMGTNQMKAEQNDDEENQVSNHQAVRDTIVREVGVFLDTLDKDESYCDCIIDEIDNMIMRNDRCNIGDGFVSQEKVLRGKAQWLFEYIKLLNDTDSLLPGNGSGYSKNKSRILKYLAQKWDIDKSILPILKGSVESLDYINKKRNEVQNSDMPHREAVLALSNLDVQEKAECKKLNALGISQSWKNISSLSDVEDGFNSIGALLGDEAETFFRRYSGKDEDEEDEDDDCEEYGLVDKVGDCIVEGICKVGELISAPFEWLSGVR